MSRISDNAIAILLIVALGGIILVLSIPQQEVPIHTANEIHQILVDLENQYKSINPQVRGVVIVASDFECGFCAQALPTLQQLRRMDDIGVVLLHNPITQIHHQAFTAAVASECAARYQLFWEYHDMLFYNQHDLSVPALLFYAQSLGMDAEQFSQCLTDQSIIDQIRADMGLARSMGVVGTPTYIIVANGFIEVLEGARSAQDIIGFIELFRQ